MKKNKNNLFFGATLSLMILFSVGITATTISNNFSAFKNVQDTSEIVIEDVEVQENKNSIDISWTISKPDDIAVKSIVIEHPDFNDNDSNPYETTLNDGNETTIMIDGLIPNTTYSNWSIYATDNLGNTSIPYKIDDFTTYSYERPIINFSVEDESVGTDSAILDWDITSNDYDKIVTQSFQIINSNDNSVVEEHSLNTEFLSGNTNLTSLEPYTKYTYKLVFSFSPWASASIEEIIKEVNFTTNALEPIIENLEVTNITDSSATLKWKIENQNETNVSSLMLTNDQGYNEDVTNKSTIEIIDLTRNTSYTFTLTLIDSEENSSSKSISFTTTNNELYIDDSYLSYKEVTSNSVTLSWKIDNDEDFNGEFFIMNGLEELSHITNSSVREITLYNLKPNAIYNLTLETHYNDADLTSQILINNFEEFTTSLVPIMIQETNVTNITGDSAMLEWTILEGTIEKELLLTNDHGYIKNVTNSNHIQLNDLTPNTNYKFNLQITDIYGNKQNKDFEEFITSDSSITPVINDVQVNDILSNSVTLSWDISNLDESNFISYQIIHPGIEIGVTFVNDINVTSIEIDNLESNRTYNDWSFILLYNNGISIDELSYQIEPFTTLDYLIPPVINLIWVSDITNNSVIINWDIDDPDSAINLIEIIHPGVKNNFTIVENLNSTSIQINGLTPNTTYDNWQFIVYYQESHSTSSKEIIKNITTFVTLN